MKGIESHTKLLMMWRMHRPGRIDGDSGEKAYDALDRFLAIVGQQACRQN
jgi:hypothetical protein